jgi:hypothetical protein
VRLTGVATPAIAVFASADVRLRHVFNSPPCIPTSLRPSGRSLRVTMS